MPLSAHSLRRRSVRRAKLLVLAGLAGPALLVASATAAPPAPTKAECVAANESGQDLRQSGKLHEARTSLAACLAPSCPGPVREDCAQRLAEVDQAVPTVVLVANDAAGRDLSAVRVTMDGTPWLEKLDGKASAVDPGAHRFRFETDGLPAKEETFVISEGEKNRRILVLLAPVTPADPPPPPPPAPTGAGLGTQRAIGLGLAVGGVVSAGAGAVLGLIAKSTQDNAVSQCRNGNPHDCSLQSVNDSHAAYGQAAGSTVAFVAAGALLAGGAVVFLTAGGSDKVKMGLVFGDRTVGLRGAW
jgi:hypothetical protein